MDTTANIITTMGIIANEVYNTTPGKIKGDRHLFL